MFGSGAASAIDGVIGATRGFGHFALKSTRTKPYSRANGAVSAVPDVATVRMAPDEHMWLALGTGELMDSLANERLVGTLYEEQGSAQAKCRKLADGAAPSGLLVAELYAGSATRAPL